MHASQSEREYKKESEREYKKEMSSCLGTRTQIYNIRVDNIIPCNWNFQSKLPKGSELVLQINQVNYMSDVLKPPKGKNQWNI